MNARALRLPERRVWLRVVEPSWADPLDSSFAAERGGRWNPPRSHPVLYLNGDVTTARRQVERLLAGSSVTIADLDDATYELLAVQLPRAQTVADAATSKGLQALGLPSTYPVDGSGRRVPAEVCQAAGSRVHRMGLRGVWCRSALTNDESGRELAWFPASAASRARRVWPNALPLGAWRHAREWQDLGLNPQPDPA